MVLENSKKIILQNYKDEFLARLEIVADSLGDHQHSMIQLKNLKVYIDRFGRLNPDLMVEFHYTITKPHLVNFINQLQPEVEKRLIQNDSSAETLSEARSFLLFLNDELLFREEAVKKAFAVAFREAVRKVPQTTIIIKGSTDYHNLRQLIVMINDFRLVSPYFSKKYLIILRELYKAVALAQ